MVFILKEIKTIVPLIENTVYVIEWPTLMGWSWSSKITLNVLYPLLSYLRHVTQKYPRGLVTLNMQQI